VAQLIARHPDRDRIVESVWSMSDGIKASATSEPADDAQKQVSELEKWRQILA